MTAETRNTANADLRSIELPSRSYAKSVVRLLLGTDEHIPHERRVGLVPKQIAALHARLAEHGLRCEILVVEGAGDRAGFIDQAYAEAGARIIKASALRDEEPFDVVHALKEPTEYESLLPGPFLRIGAVHLASKPSGVCAMLDQRNFAGIIDGGTVGNCSHLLTGGDRTPIVGSMSRFAGWVAARKLVEGVQETHRRGKVVVVGGGIAGTSAAERLAPIAEEIVVVERYEPIHADIAARIRGFGIPNVTVVEHLTDQVLDDAIGIVFAHRSGAKAAEKICNLEQIERMRPGAGIADIAIDQGGSILHPGYLETDDAHASRKKYIELFAGRYFYYAEVNMPREEPYDASITHGRTVAPYLEVLLALCALEGSPDAALTRIRQLPAQRFTDAADIRGRSLFECVVQDLRNGLQLAITKGNVEIIDQDIADDEGLSAWVHSCAST